MINYCLTLGLALGTVWNACAQPKIAGIRLAKDVDARNTIKEIQLNQLFYFQLADTTAPYSTPDSVILYINNLPMPNYPAAGIDALNKRIYFELSTAQTDKTTTNKTIIDLVRKDFKNHEGTVALAFGLGLKTGAAVSPNTIKVNFIFYTSLVGVAIPIVATAALLVLFFIVNKKGGFNDPGAQSRSLGKFQVFFWTILVAFAYLSLWIILGETPNLPPSVLGLLLISIGTTGVGAIAPTVKPKDATGFETIIAGNTNPVSVTRLQFLIFTLLFGVIFFYTAIMEMRIYDFTGQQLALMGASATGYLGMKAVNV